MGAAGGEDNKGQVGSQLNCKQLAWFQGVQYVVWKSVCSLAVLLSSPSFVCNLQTVHTVCCPTVTDLLRPGMNHLGVSGSHFA